MRQRSVVSWIKFHSKTHHGPFQYVRHMNPYTFVRWNRLYRPGHIGVESGKIFDYDRLCADVAALTPHERRTRQVGFLSSSIGRGRLMVLERFLMELWNISREFGTLRSRTWFRQELLRARKSAIIRALLRPLMDEQELEDLDNFKLTKGLMDAIQVCTVCNTHSNSPKCIQTHPNAAKHDQMRPNMTKCTQRRQRLFTRTPTSDRKMTPQQYVKRRRTTLPEERKFRREIGVIVSKPAAEEIDDHEEIWDLANDPDEKWDGARELNWDEIPWQFPVQPKLLCGPGGRPHLIAHALKGLDKYRKGTIGMFVNCFRVILVVAIFRKGGAVLSKTLRRMCNSASGIAVAFVTKSGNVTRKLWPKILELLNRRTKLLRGCQHPDGRDWKRPLVLTLDNYGTHERADLADRWAGQHGICLRPLIRNASHLQQPVDQHIGQMGKEIFKKAFMQWTISLRRASALGVDTKIDMNRFRELAVRELNNMVLQVFTWVHLVEFGVVWMCLGVFG